jgi:hypothetical protein
MKGPQTLVCWTLGIIGIILFQKHSFCWVVGLLHQISQEWNICGMYSLLIKLFPYGLMCVIVWSSGKVYILLQVKYLHQL